jgi:hypothetical protein
MALIDLIDESRERTRRDPEEREAEERQRRQDRRLLLTTDAVARIDSSLPEPLREYVVYAGQDREDREPGRWAPTFFKIEAPELAPMSFTTVVNPDGTLRVNSIRVGDKKFGADWDAAIVEAAGPERPTDTKPTRGR